LKSALKKEEAKKDEGTAPTVTQQTTPARPAGTEQKEAERKEPEAEAAKMPAELPKKDTAIKIEVLDAAGNVVRTYPPKHPPQPPPDSDGFGLQQQQQDAPGEAGLNRFNWDLRYDAVANVPGAILWGGTVQGPIAPPGKYQVRLTAGGKTFTQPFEVKADPRSTASAEDLKKQFDLLLRIQKRVGEVHEAVNQIREVRRQVNDLTKRLSSAKDKSEGDVRAAAKALDAKMTAIEEALIQPKSKSNQDPLNYGLKLNNQMAALGGDVDGADSAPTKQSYEVFDFLSARIDEQLGQWRKVQEGELKSFNQLVKERQVPAVVVTTAAAGQ
jgi:hypothetical protein